MELSLDSAFSLGGMVGHLAYVFLVLSMLMRSIVALRIFFVVNVLLNILYVTVWVRDPVQLFWESTLFLINIIQLVLIWFQNRRASFSEEEQVFAASRLRGLSRSQTRQLLDSGRWWDLIPGTRLTVEGERPTHLTYISSGYVGIFVGDQRVAGCGSGRYIGEMSVLDREPASATVTVERLARVWQLSTETLDRLVERKPAVAAVLEAGIARDMRSKLLEGNSQRAFDDAS
jgi:hypothetical protein